MIHRGLRKCFVLLHVGNRILTLGEVPKDQVYGVKLKGVSVCFAMLKAVLSGNYVNFGVFRLYGDDALDNALQTFIKLLLSIPHSDLLVCSSVSLFRLWNILRPSGGRLLPKQNTHLCLLDLKSTWKWSISDMQREHTTPQSLNVLISRDFHNY